MDLEGILNMAYETQHFGFHPRTFLDQIYNTFYENMFEGMNEMKRYLADEYSNITTAEEINKSTDALFQTLTKQLDKAIDRLEVYIDSNVFSIPDHAVLPEDEVHVTHPCSKEDEAKLDEEIEQLKQKILQERVRTKFLKSKMSEQRLVRDELMSVKLQLGQLSSSVFQTKMTKDIVEITLENCSKLCSKMKQCSKELKHTVDLC